DCFIDCVHDLSLKLCNCTDPSLKLGEDVKICSLESDAHVCCLDDVLAGVMNRTFKCDCPLPCRKSTFDMILSSSVSLTKQDKHKVPEPSRESVQNNSDSRSGLLHNLPSANENFAKLRVFYKTLDHIIYRQQPKYQSNEIFSNLGGQLGLWLGISLVAWFEALETIYLLIGYVLSKRRIQEGEN
ncbi:degenerin mec-10-like, partial [Limulus polyphemus]|uniref:Degenerin mec-10-like n=1 Tax=Limulus polyphemus TaxID=6850 RepID=A0ABM1RXX3_LIMPO